MKIARKISLIFLIAMTAISTVAVLGIYEVMKYYYFREVRDSLDSKLYAKTEHIESYLKMLRVVILRESQSVSMNNFLKQEDANIPQYAKIKDTAQAMLTLADDVNPFIYDLLLLNSKGTVVASSDGKEIGNPKAKDPYFTEGMKGVFIKEVYYSKTAHRLLMGVSAPMIDKESGKVLGVIIARVTPDDLYDVLKNRIDNSSTGETYIVSKEGYMISPSRFIPDAILKQKVDVTKIPSISFPI